VSKPPEEKPVKAPTKPGRIDREAAALRANLLKRKDQARRREEVKAKAGPVKSRADRSL
jgi:hypothetical protein